METQVVPRARGNKPTKAEHRARQDFVLELLVRGYRKGQIKRKCRDKYGISARTVERYLTRARDMIVEGTEEDRSVLVAQSRETYLKIIRSKTATHADKTRAQHCLDKLLGLQAPRRLSHEGADGGPIQVEDKTRAHRILEDPELHAQASELAVKAARRLSEGSAPGSG